MKNLKKFIPQILERCLAIMAFYFPFIEVSAYFGPKVFLSTDSIALRTFYAQNLLKLSDFYANNNLLIFIFMIWVFISCSRGTFPLTKWARFNVIQAILLNIICSCLGVTFAFLPTVIRESIFGVLFANFIYIGIVLLMAYSWLLIIYGKYPRIPIISEAAKLQVQQG
jgi:drug/metabolite transporter superfamily protein YnfA|tara:strand:+ start:516 stop:1019 length:504 start_codon:yes stop_codon:yes gene_type:complete